MDAVRRAGGIPVGLGHDAHHAPETMARLDGLLITGGAFDCDPSLYGAPPHPATSLKPDRTQAEWALLHAALDAGRPVLGICGGMQLVAIAFGGTLIQHIPDHLPAGIAHEQPNPRHEPGHDIEIVPGTRLAAITGCKRMSVNSAHHQAVDSPGRLVVSALARDGIVEAIENPELPFCLGVQWHPEFAIDPCDDAIFAAFVGAAALTP